MSPEYDGTREATALPVLELESHMSGAGSGSSLTEFKWKQGLNETLFPKIPTYLKLPRPQLPSW